MRRALVLVVVCGCTRAAEERGVPPAPIAYPCELAADVGTAHGIRMTLEERLEYTAWQGQGQLAALFAEPGVLGTEPVAVSTVVTCPDAPFLLGRGLMTDLVIGRTTAADGDEDDDLRSVILRGAYADWSEGWRIHVTPPRDAFASMRVTHADADVWASLARRWVRVDVALDAEVTDGTLVLTAPPLEAPVTDRDAPLHAGFRLVRALADGQRADLVLGAGGYLVIGGLADGAHRVTLRYEGPLPLVGDNQAEASALELTSWLPTVPGAAPFALALTVHHPIEEVLVASVPEVRPPDETHDADGTWRVEHLGGEIDRDPALVLLDRVPASRTWDDGAGSRVTLIGDGLPPFDDCEPALATAVRALAPLGPVGDVRIVAMPSVYGRHGQRAGDLVVLLRDRLIELCAGGDGAVKDEAIALVTHELAHGWFGREVRALDDEASSWWEGAAEYTSTWALDAAGAARIRRGWLDDYADQAHRDQFAMAQRAPTTGGLHDALSYAKGGLVLSALEQKLGREHVAAILRYMATTRTGQLGSWLDVVTATQAVAGSQAATWLHDWLFAVGAPELRLEDVHVADGRATFAIVVDAGGCDAPVDLVEIALFHGHRQLGSATVPLSGARTLTDLPLPAGADRISLDPWARLPRFGGDVDAPLGTAQPGD